MVTTTKGAELRGRELLNDQIQSLNRMPALVNSSHRSFSKGLFPSQVTKVLDTAEVSKELIQAVKEKGVDKKRLQARGLGCVEMRVEGNCLVVTASTRMAFHKLKNWIKDESTHTAGFDEWLTGETGFREAEGFDKKPILDAFNKLQSVVYKFLRPLHMSSAWWKCPTCMTKAEVGIKRFCENVSAHIEIAEVREYLGTERTEAIEKALSRITRSNDHGPDVPLAHEQTPFSNKPRVVRTQALMVEAVEMLIVIIGNLLEEDVLESVKFEQALRESDWESTLAASLPGFQSRCALKGVFIQVVRQRGDACSSLRAA